MRTSIYQNVNAETVAEQFVQKVKNDAKKDVIRKYAPTIVLVVMTLFSAIFVESFLSWRNIVNLLYQMTLPLVLATGLTFVLLIGSIDLSLEGVMGFSGALFALLVPNSVNDNNFNAFSIIIVLALGVLIGLVIGSIHVRLRIPSFMVTFAMGTIVRGFGLLSYKGSPATIKSDVVIQFSRGNLLGIPYITLIAFFVFILGAVVLNYTAFGRAVYAIGDNENSAQAAGINIEKTKILVFTICSFTISIAGILGAVRLKVGQVGIGDSYLFPTITAVTVGGLAAGKGGMFQTLIGVLIYTELSNYLTLMGVDSFYKQAIQGLIILVSVALSTTKSRKLIAK
ncbi:MAG: ABC transporter permease [Flexilinea sp.]